MTVQSRMVVESRCPKHGAVETHVQREGVRFERLTRCYFWDADTDSRCGRPLTDHVRPAQED
jgi:hypothetical protein